MFFPVIVEQGVEINILIGEERGRRGGSLFEIIETVDKE